MVLNFFDLVFYNGQPIGFFECLFMSAAIGYTKYLRNLKEMSPVHPLGMWCYWCCIGVTPVLLIVSKDIVLKLI